MPVTTPLRTIPAPPTPLTNYVDADGRPSREFLEYLKRIQDWMVTAQAALTELEP